MANSSDMHVDLAALLGAVVVVLLTITFEPGAWGPLSTIIGFWVLCMLFGFFWRQRPPGRSHVVDWAVLGAAAVVLALTLLKAPGALVRFLIVIFVGLWVLFMLLAFPQRRREPGSIFVGFVLSVVVGLIGAITVAQVVQWRWFRDTSYSHCRPVAVAKATMAVADLSDIDASASNLHLLANDVVIYGSTARPFVEDTTLSDAFYNAYDEAVDDCLAGDTFESLWWIGVPFFLLTLIWWNLSRLKGRLHLTRQAK